MVLPIGVPDDQRLSVIEKDAGGDLHGHALMQVRFTQLPAAMPQCFVGFKYTAISDLGAVACWDAGRLPGIWSLHAALSVQGSATSIGPADRRPWQDPRDPVRCTGAPVFAFPQVIA